MNCGSVTLDICTCLYAEKAIKSCTELCFAAFDVGQLDKVVLYSFLSFCFIGFNVLSSEIELKWSISGFEFNQTETNNSLVTYIFITKVVEWISA